MEFFNKAKAVKLRSHHDKYLVADDDQETVRQNRNGSSRKARWLVELVEGNNQVIRLKSSHGSYLAASNAPFLLGMTGKKVIQTKPKNTRDTLIEWRPIRDGFQVKLRGFGETYLRANGGPPPWRNSVTHDSHDISSTHNWVLWDVEAVDIPENEPLSDYLAMDSSFSSPVSMHSTDYPKLSIKKTGMDLFHNAKAVRLRSHHRKYLHAEEDDESVIQDRNGTSKNARWTVEFVDDADNIIRLKSCHGQYLTASNQSFLLGVSGRKVLLTVPAGRLDSSVDWEPIREGDQVKLKTRYGHFLRANGGVPPWRNSVTHGIPHRTVSQEWILWDVHLLEIILHSPKAKLPIKPVAHSNSIASESSSPSTHSNNSASSRRQKTSDSLGSSPKPKAADGRAIYYHIADESGNVQEGVEGNCITFKGNGVDELTRRLEDETGIKDGIVCLRSPLNGKLYPLRLQLPPNNLTMHVVVVQSSSKLARDFAKTGIPL